MKEFILIKNGEIVLKGLNRGAFENRLKSNLARRLRPGHVVTDEPGIYFIPALIRKWKEEGTDKGFVNYQALEAYGDFGGIRLEDDILITPDGARRLGTRRLPIKSSEIEDIMSRE